MKPPTPDRKPLQVLIVEDSAPDAGLAVRELERYGYAVDWRRVDTAETLQATLSSQVWDVVLSDYSMPRFNASRALETIKASGLDLPVIIISGTIGEETAVEIIRAGAHDYLLKDRLARLGPAVERVLSEAEGQRARQQAEKALRESEEQFRDLYENAPNAYFSVGMDGRIRRCNRRAGELLGYSTEALVGRNILDLYADTPQGKAKAMQSLERSHSGELVTDEETEMRKADGSHFWSGLTVNAVRDAEGRIVESRSIVVDITERKNAEAHLHLLSVALESAANAIVITDRTDTIEWVNPAFTTLTGYTPEESWGRNLHELVRSGLYDTSFYKELWDTIQAGRVWRGEFVNRRKDGSLYTDEHTITPVKNQYGEIHHFITIEQDITKRKRAEEEIRTLNAELEQRVAERTAQLNHAKDRIEAILNSSNDIIILCQTDGIVSQVNPAFDETFRCQPSEAVLQPLTGLVISQHVPILEKAFAAVVETQQPTRLEVTVRYKEQVSFDADVVLSPIIQHDNRRAGVVCSLRDMTQRKQLEAQLRQTLDHEMELSELRSRYVSMAAHDLRNPLAVIQSAIGLIQHYSDRMTDEQQQSKFDHIQTNIKVMVDMLDDILTIGHVESGRLTFNPTPLDVIAFCHNIVTDIEQATGTTRPIDFSTQGVCNIAHMDAKLMRHILGNLLSNAIKYSPEPSAVKFTVGFEPDQITFWIQDQGIGIPQAEQPQMFEAFYRASNVGLTLGTGLGLAIVKRSVDLHRGTISFKSEQGVGTTFAVILPSIRAESISG